jgi:hypothetical protein
MAIVGYIFSVPVLYFGVDNLVAMALNTAISFSFLGFGLIIISKIKTINEA